MDVNEIQIFAEINVLGYFTMDVLLMVLLFVLSLIGNILVAFVGIWSRKLKSIQNLAIVHLAISNLLVFMSVPLMILCELAGASCVDLNEFLASIHGLASWLLISLVAADRYIFNCRKQWTHKWSYKDAKVSTCVIWLFAISSGLGETSETWIDHECRVYVGTISNVLVAALAVGTAVLFAVTVSEIHFRAKSNACGRFELLDLELNENDSDEARDQNSMTMALICVYLALSLPLLLAHQIQYWIICGDECKSTLILIRIVQLLAESKLLAVPLVCFWWSTEFRREFFNFLRFPPNNNNV